MEEPGRYSAAPEKGPMAVAALLAANALHLGNLRAIVDSLQSRARSHHVQSALARMKQAMIDLERDCAELRGLLDP